MSGTSVGLSRIVFVVGVIVGLPILGALAVSIVGSACVPIENLGFDIGCEGWPHIALYVLGLNVGFMLVLVPIVLLGLRQGWTAAWRRLTFAVFVAGLTPLAVLILPTFF